MHGDIINNKIELFIVLASSKIIIVSIVVTDNYYTNLVIIV